jgi:hypothetical protein
VRVYRKIRGAIDAKEEEHKTEIDTLKEQLGVVEAKLLDICNTQNIDSLRTPQGTVMRSVRTRYWTSDWEKLYDFIDKHGAPYLLERRISSSAMKDFLQQSPDIPLPEGLNTDSRYAITVRKPTNK